MKQNYTEDFKANAVRMVLNERKDGVKEKTGSGLALCMANLVAAKCKT